MLILVANLGSTSFKYKLLDVSGDIESSSVDPASRVLAKGAVGRIGDASSPCEVSIGDYHHATEQPVPDHGVAVEACLAQLSDPENGCLKDAAEIQAIGFKAVHGGRRSGTFLVDDDVLDAMAEMNAAAPAHNPPYIAAMNLLRERFPEMPLVAAFETEFHDTIPVSRRTYAIPKAWTDDFQIKRWGFHGSSHQYIAWRSSQLLERSDAKVISLHLGGSSSITAIDSGRSVATTMGMTPQTGLPQNNRVGDFDGFALPLILQRTGLDLDAALQKLASEGGLLGLSGGLSGDIRDLENAADTGNADAELALAVYVEEIRRHLGSMMVALGGVDLIAFTGGIGENAKRIRSSVCRDLGAFGIELDESRNESAAAEDALQAPSSRTQIRVIPTDEEWIVATRAKRALGLS